MTRPSDRRRTEPAGPDTSRGAAGEPTIYDVARESGFSIKTVSRVINGEPNVREGTVQAVRAAIARLDYHPNPAARRLGGGKLPTIGVLLDTITDPFFAELGAVIEGRAMEIGMDVLLASTGRDERRVVEQIQRLVRHGITGLVFAPLGTAAGIKETLPADLPSIVVDRTCGICDRDVVRATDEEGAYEAVRHLIRHGHERIAFLGRTAQFSTMADRYAGYRRALTEAGLEFDHDLVNISAWRTEEVYPTVLSMLSAASMMTTGPTAIFAASPMMGEAALRVQKELGRGDVALVVFGDFPAAALMTPPTTVVDQHPRQLANAAFDLLVRRLESPDAEFVHRLIPTTLVPRGSGELAPAGRQTGVLA